MTYEPSQDDFGAVCPYLGLADDADSHATYATEAHRCFRLPNPTRIATSHQETYCLGAKHISCPVYLGEGVPGASASKGGAPAAVLPGGSRPAAAPAPPSRTVRGPKTGEPAGRPQRERPPAAPTRRPSPGAIGPRPRGGGVSLPVATIGLFSLAIVVVALAFAINKLSGNGSPNSGIPIVGANQTATRAAAGGGKTPTVAVGTRAAGTGTPGASTTAGAGTPTGSQTPGGTGTAKSYTVKSGDTCSGIAAANNATLQALLDANNMTEGDCATLQPGQTLKLP